MKKNFTLLILISIFISNSTYPQLLFKKDYDTSSNGRFTLGELNSGTYVMGLTRGLNRLDQSGNITFRQLYAGGLLTINFLKIINNEIYFDGTYNDTCGTQLRFKPCRGILDTNGVVLSAQAYSLDGRCSNYIINSSVCYDNGIISVGKRDQVFNPNLIDHAFVIRSDSMGNLNWAKFYSNKIGGGAFVKQSLDSGFIVGFNFDSCGATVAKLDSSGNVQWSKSYIRPRAVLSDAIENADGTLMICGLTDSSSSGKLFFMKIDPNGSVLWAKGFDGINSYHFILGLPHLTKTLDGNIALVASKLSQVYNYSSLVLLKLNISGDTLWTKAIGGPDYSAYQMNIYNTSDNGFLVSGTINGSFPMATSLLFLYKTDSLFNTSCANYSEPIFTTPIFPTDSNVVLTSIDGGYGYPVNIGNVNIAPTLTYEDCLYTNVSSSTFKRNFEAYPNPTTGILTMEVEGPLMSDCYFSVYDYTGRLVFQRTLYTEKERIEVDLSPFGKGLYLIEFTEKDMVSVKKVVVE